MRSLCLPLFCILAGCAGAAGSGSCGTSSDCPSGICEPSPRGTSQFCLAMDVACPTGFRWSPTAGDGLAGQCVGPPPASGPDLGAPPPPPDLAPPSDLAFPFVFPDAGNLLGACSFQNATWCGAANPPGIQNPDPNTLYSCVKGQWTASPCSNSVGNKCFMCPPSVNDTCDPVAAQNSCTGMSADYCPYQNGEAWCGDDMPPSTIANPQAGTLYTCTNHQWSASSCSGACQHCGAGTADTCGTCPVVCGKANDACCDGFCEASLACKYTECQPCGIEGIFCCDGSTYPGRASSPCSSGLVCDGSGICRVPPPCGSHGQPCCPGNICEGGSCAGGVCP